MQSKSMRMSKTEQYYLALLKPICPWAVREDPRPFYRLWRRFNGQGQLCHLTLACENISAKREEKRMPSQANLTYEGGRETIPERAQFSPGGKKKKKEKRKAGREGGGGPHTVQSWPVNSHVNLVLLPTYTSFQLIPRY